MGRTEIFAKNVLSTGLASIVTMLAGFVIPRIMLTVYGSEVNGLVTSVSQFISYFSLVEAGIGASTTYALYSPLADHDTACINRIITASKNFYLKTGYIFLSLIMAGALIYPIFIKTDVLSFFEVSFLFLILGFNSVIDFFSLAKYRTLLTADQKTYVISLANIVQTVLNCLIIVVLSYLGCSVVIVRLFALAAILLRSFILWIYCKKAYSFIDFSVEPDKSALDKRWDALYLQILGAIHSGAPAVIATLFLSLVDVSVYSIFNVVMAGISSVLGIFTSGLSSGFGDLISRHNDKAFENAFRQFEYIYYALITVVYSVTLVMYMPFIRLYTAGADMSYDYPLLAFLMTVNGFFYNLKTPYGMLVISEGKYKETKWATTVQGLLEILCGSLFASFFGLNGIVLGSLVSNLYRVVQFLFFAQGNLIPFKVRKSVTMSVRNTLLFFLMPFLINRVKLVDSVDSILSWIGAAVIVMIFVTAIVMTVNLIFDRSLFKAAVDRIKTIFIRA